jgi:hypothetical protein
VAASRARPAARHTRSYSLRVLTCRKLPMPVPAPHSYLLQHSPMCCHSYRKNCAWSPQHLLHGLRTHAYSCCTHRSHALESRQRPWPPERRNIFLITEVISCALSTSESVWRPSAVITLDVLTPPGKVCEGIGAPNISWLSSARGSPRGAMPRAIAVPRSSPSPRPLLTDRGVHRPGKDTWSPAGKKHGIPSATNGLAWKEIEV